MSWCLSSSGADCSGAKGFSLVELLVVLAVLAVIARMAIPAFDTLMRNAGVSAAANELISALFLARSEAIKRGRRSTLCTSADGEFCAQGIDWTDGWLLFVDTNGNGQRDAGEARIRVSGARDAPVTIRGNAPVKSYVSYLPTGVTRALNGALQMGTLTVCDRDAVRRIVISASGRPRLEAGGVCSD